MRNREEILVEIETSKSKHSLAFEQARSASLIAELLLDIRDHLIEQGKIQVSGQSV